MVDVWIFIPHILGDTPADSSISIILFVFAVYCYDGGETGIKCAVLCNVLEHAGEIEGGVVLKMCCWV